MTDASFTRNRENYCYRHPDRQSFVLCQRCTRTICPECQTQGAVGVVCPECMKEQAAARTPAQKKAERRWGSGAGAVTTTSAFRALPVTYSLLAITIVVSLMQMIPGGLGAGIEQALRFAGLYIDPEVLSYPQLGIGFEPWRALTVLLVHGGILHLAFNMLALWMMGRILEPLLGAGKFLTLYLISGFAGSVLMALLAPTTPVVGASGAIFGTFGALFIITRTLGGNVTQILVVLAINFAYGFFVGGVAWQAHVGGLLGGAAVAGIYVMTRKRSDRTKQILMLAGLCVLLIGACFLIPVFHPIA